MSTAATASAVTSAAAAPTTAASTYLNSSSAPSNGTTTSAVESTVLLHIFVSALDQLAQATPLFALYIVAGVLAFSFLLCLVVGLCCCQPKNAGKKGGYSRIDSDDEDDEFAAKVAKRPPSRNDAAAAAAAPSRRAAKSPFDALHLRSSNVQPKGGESAPLIPDPNHPAVAVKALSAFPPALSPHEVLSTASLPAKFHRREEPEMAGVDVNSGFVKVIFNYRPNSKKMFLFVETAEELPAADRAGYSRVQIRIALLPAKKQKFVTKWVNVSGKENDDDDDDDDDDEERLAEVSDGERLLTKPTFKQSFTCRGIAPEDASKYGIRLRVYAATRLRSKKMVSWLALRF